MEMGRGRASVFWMPGTWWPWRWLEQIGRPGILPFIFPPADNANPISDTAKEEFRKLQANIPSTFVNTAQLREAAKGGTADILSISYQTYINTPEFADYKYIPFGIRQDSPLYATTKDATKQEVLKRFVEFAKNKDNQDKATSYGFNQLNDYSFTEQTTDGNMLMSMQNLWKKNKNSAKPIIGVFVADVSA